MQPNDEVLARFGVRLVVPFGGTRNRHWLVESRRQQWVLRRWWRSVASIDWASIGYEVRLVASLAALGWPVAPAVAGPEEIGGHVWSLAPFLSGDMPPAIDPHGNQEEQRARGRLLARFHAGLAQLPERGQRAGWRRCEEILADPMLDAVLTRNEPVYPEDVRVLRWHLERARERVAGLHLPSRPGIVIHGDFTPWNLRFTDRRLTGILDFELSHEDHRIGDFALSWRGKYDEVIRGYAEVSPLEPEEWELITPLWWAQLIEGACRDLQNGTRDDGWTIQKLRQRSALMGPDAAEFR